MEAGPKFDALVRCDPSVALDHRPLDFNGAVHRVDDTPELDNCAIAGALDDPAVVHGYGRIDQIATEAPQPRQCAILIHAREPAVADNIRDQNRRDLTRPPMAHPLGVTQDSTKARPQRCLFVPHTRAGLDSQQQRLRLGDLGHLVRRRETFESGREDGLGFG